eukprot:TRINITY_DN72447_c0_g1_i1.p2 TRINITY_DN72447_c0_g1~~TRINITY_DN72447_c0_g1_i1.p2  ORF type:complete len:261 (-),score=53.56 TRINITY_DN72447_c0_g1_i1:62-844(-)
MCTLRLASWTLSCAHVAPDEKSSQSELIVYEDAEPIETPLPTLLSSRQNVAVSAAAKAAKAEAVDEEYPPANLEKQISFTMASTGDASGDVSASDVAAISSRASVEAEAPRHPDFSGSWRMVRVDGDIDAVNADELLPAAVRTAARGTFDGAGKISLFTRLQGDEILTKTRHSAKPRAVYMRRWADGQERLERTASDHSVMVRTQWEGESLVMDSWRVQPQEPPVRLPTTRRSMVDGNLVIDYVFHGKRVHVLRASFERL